MPTERHDKCRNDREDEYSKHRDIHRDFKPAVEGHRGGLLELLGPDERVGEVGEKPRRHETREPIVEDHGKPPLQPVAGVGVSDRSREEAETEGDKNEVQHAVLLARYKAGLRHAVPGCDSTTWARRDGLFRPG
jgi:hypothetical protein